MEIKRGLARFYRIPNRIFTDIVIIVVLAAALFANTDDARLRIVTICFASILVYLDTLFLLGSRRGREAVAGRSIYILYGLAIVVMTIRLILGLGWDPRGNPLDSGNSLSTISILFFVTNTVIFFGLLFIVLSRVLDERNSLIERIRSVSITDELTGLMNRRGFKDVMKYEENRFTRSQEGYTFVICDIDHFKAVNDNYGHECGDSVLQDIAAILLRNRRATDTAARWGGEEFVLLLPGTNEEESILVQERIRSEIEETTFRFESRELTLAMSFGACCRATAGVDIDEIVTQADRNLYSAKDAGRNRIVASTM